MLKSVYSVRLEALDLTGDEAHFKRGWGPLYCSEIADEAHLIITDEAHLIMKNPTVNEPHFNEKYV